MANQYTYKSSHPVTPGLSMEAMAVSLRGDLKSFKYKLEQLRKSPDDRVIRNEVINFNEALIDKLSRYQPASSYR